MIFVFTLCCVFGTIDADQDGSSEVLHDDLRSLLEGGWQHGCNDLNLDSESKPSASDMSFGKPQ
jgi:hypothetical protein